jgi:hypothetical protein
MTKRNYGAFGEMMTRNKVAKNFCVKAATSEGVLHACLSSKRISNRQWESRFISTWMGEGKEKEGREMYEV